MVKNSRRTRTRRGGDSQPAYGQQPAAYGQQPAAYGQQPATSWTDSFTNFFNTTTPSTEPTEKAWYNILGGKRRTKSRKNRKPYKKRGCRK
jgi:hypothetical protein